MSNNANIALSKLPGRYEITVSQAMGFNDDWSLTDDFIAADVKFVYEDKAIKTLNVVSDGSLRLPKAWVKDHKSVDDALTFARARLEPALQRFVDYYSKTGKRWEFVRKRGCEMELLP